jgi:hypothetical protein
VSAKKQPEAAPDLSGNDTSYRHAVFGINPVTGGDYAQPCRHAMFDEWKPMFPRMLFSHDSVNFST